METRIDEQAALKELVARGLKLPPWPKVLGELKDALQGGINVRGVAKIIGQDPGLAAMLFRVANSPVIVKGKKNLTRLDQILQILGTKQIFHLIQAMALTTAITSANRKAFDTFWRRSAEVADLAALIAGEMVSVRQVPPEQAYMAGIFRECGIPVLMQRFPDYCEHIAFEQAQCGPTIHAEDRRFNVDHSTIGYLVARHWKLPDFIALAILHHCEMPRHELGEVRSVVAILHLANHCYNHLRHIETENWHSLRDEVFAELGIHDDEADFLARIEERFNAAA